VTCFYLLAFSNVPQRRILELHLRFPILRGNPGTNADPDPVRRMHCRRHDDPAFPRLSAIPNFSMNEVASECNTVFDGGQADLPQSSGAEDGPAPAHPRSE
jgi:hypothetical protein